MPLYRERRLQATLRYSFLLVRIVCSECTFFTISSTVIPGQKFPFAPINDGIMRTDVHPVQLNETRWRWSSRFKADLDANTCSNHYMQQQSDRADAAAP